MKNVCIVQSKNKNAIVSLQEDGITNNFKGLILGNPLVSPSLVLTKLGFYLEELGYIDSDGRVRVDNYTNGIQTLVASESYEQAFGYFTSLGQFINENAGAVAVNLNYIVEKLTRVTNRGNFYLNSNIILFKKEQIWKGSVITASCCIYVFY